MRYPPGDDMDQNMTGQHDKHTHKSRGIRHDIFCKPAMNKNEILKKVESLASKIEKSQNMRQVPYVLYYRFPRLIVLPIMIIIFKIDLAWTLFMVLVLQYSYFLIWFR